MRNLVGKEISERQIEKRVLYYVIKDRHISQEFLIQWVSDDLMIEPSVMLHVLAELCKKGKIERKIFYKLKESDKRR